MTHKSIVIREAAMMSTAEIRALIDENAKLRSRVIQLENQIRDKDEIIMNQGEQLT